MIQKGILENECSSDLRMVFAIDVQKALDTIRQETVIQEAKQKGLRGRALAFIKSFGDRYNIV